MTYEIEKRSLTWQSVRAWADARIADAREKLEAPAGDISNVPKLRHEIAVLKELLDLEPING